MKSILFVDDEQRVLSGLRRQLFGKRGEWRLQTLWVCREAAE